MRTAFPYQSVLLLVFASLAMTGEALLAESPTEAVDRVWKAWDSQNADAPGNFPDVFIRLSKSVSDVQGAAVIAPIMVRAKDWKPEDFLIFVAVVAFAPREQTFLILERYQKFGKKWERQCASDLLIELNTSDVKEMVAKWTKE